MHGDVVAIVIKFFQTSNVISANQGKETFNFVEQQNTSQTTRR